MRPKKIAVLMGGISSEREVSLRSGNAVVKALTKAGYDVTGIDVRDKVIRELDNKEIDVVFIALHGYFGEDGGVQELLDSKGIIYTGSDANASKLAMNKLATKRRFIEFGLKTPEFIALKKIQKVNGIKDDIERLGLPVVLKHTNNGSSIGVSLIRNIGELQLSIQNAFEAGHEVFLEKYIKGREFTIGILEEKALPIIEIKPPEEFFDYDAKYKDSNIKYLNVKVSASDGTFLEEGELSPSLYEEARDLAVKAHKALGCTGFSRVDMLLDENNEFNLLELNTIPGFTEKSLLPMAARAAGINFASLCGKIIDYSFRNMFVGASGVMRS